MPMTNTHPIITLLMSIQANYASLNLDKNHFAMDISQTIETANQTTDPVQQTQQVIKALEDVYKKELMHFTQQKLFFSKPRTHEDFINELNRKWDAHHGVRVIGLALQKIYRENPTAAKHSDFTKHIHDIKAPNGNPAYDNIFPIDRTLLEKPEIKALKNACALLTDRELYTLTMGQDVIDVNRANQLWPELRKTFLFKDDEIKQLLQHGVTQDLRELAVNNATPPLAEPLPSLESKRAMKAKQDQIESKLTSISAQLEAIHKVKERYWKQEKHSASPSTARK